MISVRLISLLALITLCSGAATTVAETIRIPLGSQGSSEYVERPTLGMDMRSVEARFGAPLEQVPARGEPPISRWVYANFVVYFEANIVIHSVVRHQPRADS